MMRCNWASAWPCILAFLAAVAPAELRPQSDRTILLRWRLAPGRSLTVRANAGVGFSLSGDSAEAAERNTIALFGNCAGAPAMCDVVSAARDVAEAGIGSTRAEATAGLRQIRGDGVVTLSIDSLLHMSAYGAARPGLYDPAVVLEDLLSALPLVLPAKEVRAGSAWDVAIDTRRTWNKAEFRTSLRGTAQLDSVTEDRGLVLAWIKVSVRQTRTRGPRAEPYSDDNVEANITWDVNHDRPLSSAVQSRGGVQSPKGRRELFSHVTATFDMNGKTQLP